MRRSGNRSSDRYFQVKIFMNRVLISGLPGDSSGKEPANAGGLRDVDSGPGLGRLPGGGDGNSLQYFYLENPMDRGAWRATIHGVTKKLK